MELKMASQYTQINLTEEERQKLDKIVKTTDDPIFRNRAHAVLLVDQGRTQTEAGEILNVGRPTIYKWLRKYNEGGIEGLQVKWSSGRTPLISDDFAPLIIEWIDKGPVGCGLNRANWTFAELATHFYQTQGIKVSETTMREFCHRHDIRPYRPTYRYVKADPQKQEEAKQKLSLLKKKRSIIQGLHF